MTKPTVDYTLISEFIAEYHRDNPDGLQKRLMLKLLNKKYKSRYAHIRSVMDEVYRNEYPNNRAFLLMQHAHTQTEATRQKISASQIGKKRSAETCKKQSESRKAWWARHKKGPLVIKTGTRGPFSSTFWPSGHTLKDLSDAVV